VGAETRLGPHVDVDRRFFDGRTMAETKVLPFFTIDSWVELLAEALIPGKQTQV